MAADYIEHTWEVKLPILIFAYRTNAWNFWYPFLLTYGPILPEDVIFSLPAQEVVSSEDYIAVLIRQLQQAFQQAGDSPYKKAARTPDEYFQQGQLDASHIMQMSWCFFID